MTPVASRVSDVGEPEVMRSPVVSVAREFWGAALTALILSAATLLVLELFGSSAATSLLITVTAVVGLQIFTGNSGIISFGHAGFAALGAYVSGLLTMPAALKGTVLPNLPGWLAATEYDFGGALVITAAVIAGLGAVLGYVFVRLGGYSAAIASLGVLVIVHAALLGLPDFTRGAQTFYGLQQATTLQIALMVAVGAVLAGRLFRGSRSGLQLRASREDELAAQSFGVNVRKRRLQAWTMAATLAGLSGALLAHYITAFSPKQFYFALTFNYIVMLIIGGPSTVSGAVLGSILVTALSETLRGIEAGFQLGPWSVGPFFGATQVILALLMLSVMFFRPHGLVGLREPDEIVADWWRRRNEQRR